MAIKFDELLDDDEAAVIDPRDIFLTLDRDKKFAFPRDIQTEVMKAWFDQRNNSDTIVKLNVGSGKTLVGLLMLQSSLNEGVRPAIYIAPDKQLVQRFLDSNHIERPVQMGVSPHDRPLSYDRFQGIDVLDRQRSPGLRFAPSGLQVNSYSLGAPPGSARSSQSAITAAMASLFFSSIIMWPLPWMPTSGSRTNVLFTPARARYCTVQ